MAKHMRLSFFVITLAILMSHNAFAIDVEELIEARQGYMKLYGVNMDILGDMVKGRTRYDAKIAQNAADNLFALAKMKNAALWPPGSSLADQGLKDKTWAKPEIWSNQREVSEKHAQLTQSIETLAGNAGWSLDSMEDSLRTVGDRCKGCHKKYRARK